MEAPDTYLKREKQSKNREKKETKNLTKRRKFILFTFETL